jgi:hypothetical protein
MATIPRHERAVLPFKEGTMLVAVVRLRGRKRKGSVFRFAPRKRIYLPILELSPAASFSRTPPSRPRASRRVLNMQLSAPVL